MEGGLGTGVLLDGRAIRGDSGRLSKKGVVPRVSVSGKNLDIKRLSTPGDLSEAVGAASKAAGEGAAPNGPSSLPADGSRGARTRSPLHRCQC